VFCLRALALAVGLFATTAVAVAGEDQDWQPETPAPPMPEKFDWIQLTSDEWLKGEFIVMYDDVLEFDSKEMNLQKIDLEDVREVRTAQIMQVGLVSGEILVGKLFIDGEVVRVIGEQDRRILRTEILSITAGEPKEINFWSGKVTLGLNVRQGNSDTVEMNSSLKFQRRTVRNRATLEYLGAYNLAEDLETANNHRATLLWDRFLNRRLFVKPIYVEWFKDPFQNISHRETAGIGAGYEVIDKPKTDWTISGGPAYQQTKFVSVEEGTPDTESTPAFSFGSDLEMELTGWLDYFWQYSFQIVNEISGKYTHHFVMGFETEVSSLLDFDIKMIWDRTQNPRPTEDGSVPLQDDYRLVVGLVFDW
jgi:putative salt-induced outer membrane protein YdiY